MSTLQLGRMLFVFHNEELGGVLAIGEFPGVMVRASSPSARISQEHRECLTQVTFHLMDPQFLAYKLHERIAVENNHNIQEKHLAVFL